MPTQTNLIGSGCAPLQAQASIGIPSTGQTATGSTQGTAVALQSDFSIFTTVAASTGARLPAASGQTNIGDSWVVVNHGANALTVYPATGGSIANGSVNSGFNVPVNKTAFFYYVGSGNWAAALSA